MMGNYSLDTYCHLNGHECTVHIMCHHPASSIECAFAQARHNILLRSSYQSQIKAKYIILLFRCRKLKEKNMNKLSTINIY